MVRYALTVVRSFVRKDEAQDLVEYALLVGLIALGAVGVLGTLNTEIGSVFTNIANELRAAAN